MRACRLREEVYLNAGHMPETDYKTDKSLPPGTYGRQTFFVSSHMADKRDNYVQSFL